MDADTAIRAIVARLPPADVAYLLETRGLPARGGVAGGGGRGAAAAATLAAALGSELVEWEWESGDVGPPGSGAYHVPITGAGGSLTVAGNALWAFGGLNGDRVQDAGLWRWDLGPAGASGFEPVTLAPHSPPPPRLASGHFASAGPEGRVWVFPGPRNPDLGAAWAFDPATRAWEEVALDGRGPADPAARRAVGCGLVEGGKALLALGGPASAHTVHRFDFRARAWGQPVPLAGGPPAEGWIFGGAAIHGPVGAGRLVMWGACPGGDEVGTPPQGGEGGGEGGGGGGSGGGASSSSASASASASSDGPPVALFALDWAAKAWTRVASSTPPPPLRTHAAGAVVGDSLILQGGRRPGPFNVTASAWEFDFSRGAWHPLFAADFAAASGAAPAGPAAREWHAAAGLADCAVFVGGRTAIPPYEPVPVTPDTMSCAVDILWVRKDATRVGGAGGTAGGAPASASSSAPPPIGRAAMLAALASHSPAAAGPGARDPTADVILLAGEQGGPGGLGGGGPVPFAAHRFVLAAHSAVFAAMWGSGMREGSSCGGVGLLGEGGGGGGGGGRKATTDGGPPAPLVEVALPDVAPPTAAALLAYCYGSSPALPATVPELRALYEVADKYDMPGLMGEVLGGLRARAGAADLAGLLALADARHSAPLRSVCADAATRSLPALLASPSFAALVTGAPALGLGLISEVVAKLGVGGVGKAGVAVDEEDDDDDGGVPSSSSTSSGDGEEEGVGVDGEGRAHLSPRGAVEVEVEVEEEAGDLASPHPTPPASPRGGGGGGGAPAPPTPGQ